MSEPSFAQALAAKLRTLLPDGWNEDDDEAVAEVISAAAAPARLAGALAMREKCAEMLERRAAGFPLDTIYNGGIIRSELYARAAAIRSTEPEGM